MWTLSPKEHTGISGKPDCIGPIAGSTQSGDLSYKLVRGVFSITGSLWLLRLRERSAAVSRSLRRTHQHGEALRHPKCGESRTTFAPSRIAASQA